MENLFQRRVTPNNSLCPVSSTVRNFRDVPGASGPENDSVVWKHFADPVSTMKEKNENLSWTLGSLTGEVRSKESLRSFDRTPTSTTVVSHLIEDDQHLPQIMEPQLSDFDMNLTNIPSASPSCVSKGTKLGHGEDSNTSIHSSSPLMSTDTTPLLNLDNSSFYVPKIKTEPDIVSALVGDGFLSGGFVDYASQPQHHLQMYKAEYGSNTPTDAQYWCQPTGLPDIHRRQVAFLSPDGIYNSYMVHSSPNVYGDFLSGAPSRSCVICGDEASGCHYGVVTCGSCKVFFKRAVEGRHNYLCAGRNDCIVDKIRRKNCPACRLRKCYQAGMMLGGRKLKKFAALKPLGLTQSLLAPAQRMFPGDSHALASLPYLAGIQELQLSPQIIHVLENIEPEVVYSGYDNSQPDMPNLLLNSLNRLGERQLVCIVKWSKSLPGFRGLHINDQMTLIQYSWMSLMVFSLGWRSFQNVTSEYLYFAPDLILNEERMKRSPIYELCLAMKFIPQEFAKLQVTKEEFLCMKALLLLNLVPLEGLRSQSQFEEMRQSYIRELTMAIHLQEKSVVVCSQRFYHLTKLMDHMHTIVQKLNLFCLSTFIQAEAMRVEFPEMMSEVITSQLPKVLAGMVKPLLFHTK